MPVSIMRSKGRITIPKEIRDQLRLRPGQKVEFRVDTNGTARILPVSRKTGDVFGMLSSPEREKPVSVAQMDKSIQKTLKKKTIVPKKVKRLERLCNKLDPNSERLLADEGMNTTEDRRCE